MFTNTKLIKEVLQEVKEIKKMLNEQRRKEQKEIEKKEEISQREILKKKIKNPGSDLSLEDFANVLGIDKKALTARVWQLKKTTTWANNENFIYEFDLHGNKTAKYFTKAAQDAIIRKYGYGYKFRKDV